MAGTVNFSASVPPPPSDMGPRASLLVAKHCDYIANLDKDENFEYHATEHLRMSGVYWGVTAMHLMGALDRMDGERLLAWVPRCQRAGSGGFGGDVGHDPHMLYTLSAVQILVVYGRLDLVDCDAAARYVASLQQPGGGFAGDAWGEVDTRFTYCALNCLSLLGRMDLADVPAAVESVGRCRNFDGGFGCVPGGESHAGQVFTCVAALALGGGLDRHCDADQLGWWLAERQCASGGFNGRPEKLPDVCYSWWVLSSLAVLGRLGWVDGPALRRFILWSQDEHGGGISDRPEDQVDVFHTFFGVAGLSLLGAGPEVESGAVGRIDPVFALPEDVLERHFAGRARYWSPAPAPAPPPPGEG